MLFGCEIYEIWHIVVEMTFWYTVCIDSIKMVTAKKGIVLLYNDDKRAIHPKQHFFT